MTLVWHAHVRVTRRGPSPLALVSYRPLAHGSVAGAAKAKALVPTLTHTPSIAHCTHSSDAAMLTASVPVNFLCCDVAVLAREGCVLVVSCPWLLKQRTERPTVGAVY